jgi:alkyl sulfatase BDS1-like metallo-beta-lactamase superfamily hydrolase
MKTRQKTAQPTDFSGISTAQPTDFYGISVEGNKTEKVEYNTSTIFSNISKNILLNDEALKHTSLSASEKELKKASEL